MIVTYDEYISVYCGEPIVVTEYPRAEAKAERLIKQITHGRTADFSALPMWQQDAVKEAIVAQVEYYAIEGMEVSVAGQSAPVWTVGKVSVGGGRQDSGKATGASTMVCPAAIAALEQTGLLNADVPTVDYPRLEGWWPYA